MYVVEPCDIEIVVQKLCHVIFTHERFIRFVQQITGSKAQLIIGEVNVAEASFIGADVIDEKNGGANVFCIIFICILIASERLI